MLSINHDITEPGKDKGGGLRASGAKKRAFSSPFVGRYRDPEFIRGVSLQLSAFPIFAPFPGGTDFEYNTRRMRHGDVGGSIPRSLPRAANQRRSDDEILGAVSGKTATGLGASWNRGETFPTDPRPLTKNQRKSELPRSLSVYLFQTGPGFEGPGAGSMVQFISPVKSSSH